MHCPLCLSNSTVEYTCDSLNRALYKCNNCEGVFVNKDAIENPLKEKERYLTHNNSIENKGYVDFLVRAVTPALPFLDPSMKGLDYGSGPKPVLTEILKRKGYACDYYDLYFQPELPKKQYDYIFSTETFEHFAQPRKEIKTICKLLKKYGFLVIMTQPYHDETNFQKWYYAGDFTHVFFYHSRTVKYLAKEFLFEILYTDEYRGVWVLRKMDT